MDHHRGKMSRKHECQQCVATFSKRSLLDEHKRILGHQDVYRCLSDGGVKKKATQDGPPMKRKITKYDDPSDSYTKSAVGTQKMPKFNTTSTRYKVAVRELDVRVISNILRSLRILFNSIIKDVTEFMEPADLVRLSVQCPELDFPISLPFMKLSQLYAERFLTEIKRVLQSYEQFVMDETLEIELIYVNLPSGGIVKRCKYVDLGKTLEEKRCVLQIQNNDVLCCPRAIRQPKPD
ncbi:unnamed protein product [Mytilus coruscus]|uniref:C2H2-type domain-containing protein n=1 Tax=Mytilus coruscus TaxID=42192 RepID=A0A6J8DY71_MYTCO|nr:unnamed protein product [Mytilus coruscus]